MARFVSSSCVPRVLDVPDTSSARLRLAAGTHSARATHANKTPPGARETDPPERPPKGGISPHSHPGPRQHGCWRPKKAEDGPKKGRKVATKTQPPPAKGDKNGKKQHADRMANT